MNPETLWADDDLAGQLVARASSVDYQRWWSQVGSTGYCAHPIRLAGRRATVDADTGELIRELDTGEEPDGVLLTGCGNRRAAVCPSCSAVYRSDTWQLVAAGLRGGKGLPATVAEHPALFVTLTAPSFGPVHSRRERHGQGRVCRPARTGRSRYCAHGQPVDCLRRHCSDDPALGSPLCSACFDYPGAVLWNATVPELWRRTTIYLRRALAARAGLSPTALAALVRISFTKVAEYQARGVIHLHVVLRLDAASPPGQPERLAPPAMAGLPIELMTAAAQDVVGRVQAPMPSIGDGRARVARWGAQLDIRPIAAVSSRANPTAIAAYVAKYATKAADVVAGGLDRRIRSLAELAELRLSVHARRLVETCWALGGRPELAELKLRRWAHMLGFGGHFSTRSRRYSTTLTALRTARATWAGGGKHSEIGERPEAVVVTTLRYAGTDHASQADALLVRTAAGLAREASQEAREQRRRERHLSIGFA